MRAGPDSGDSEEKWLRRGPIDIINPRQSPVFKLILRIRRRSMARKIALTNQKGGVGKTTAALGLAGGLTRRGKRVLRWIWTPRKRLGSLGLIIGVTGGP